MSSAVQGSATTASGVAPSVSSPLPSVPSAMERSARDLASMAMKDPADIARRIETVQASSVSVGADLAAHVAGDLDAAALRELAKTTAGRGLLDMLESAISVGRVDAHGQAQLDRIHDARRSVATTPQDRADLLLRQASRPDGLDAVSLGKSVADEVQQGANGLKIAERVLAHAAPGDRSTVADEIVRHLDDRTLKDLVRTPGGAKLLQQLRETLSLPYGLRHPQVLRMDGVLPGGAFGASRPQAGAAAAAPAEQPWWRLPLGLLEGAVNPWVPAALDSAPSLASTAGAVSRDALDRPAQTPQQQRTPDVFDLLESWANLGAPLGAPAVAVNTDGHPRVLTGGVDAESNWDRFWNARNAVDAQMDPVRQGVELGKGIKNSLETGDYEGAGRNITQLGMLVAGTVLMLGELIPGRPGINATPTPPGGGRPPGGGGTPPADPLPAEPTFLRTDPSAPAEAPAEGAPSAAEPVEAAAPVAAQSRWGNWDLAELMTGTPYTPTQRMVYRGTVEAMADQMEARTFNWRNMDDKIIVDSRGNILQGHHRIVAARLARVPIPKEAITVLDLPRDPRPWSLVRLQNGQRP